MKRSIKAAAGVTFASSLLAGCAWGGSASTPDAGGNSPESQSSPRPVATDTARGVGQVSCNQNPPELHHISDKDFQALSNAAAESRSSFETKWVAIGGPAIHCMVDDFSGYYGPDSMAAAGRSLATSLNNDYGLRVGGITIQGSDNALVLK